MYHTYLENDLVVAFGDQCGGAHGNGTLNQRRNYFDHGMYISSERDIHDLIVTRTEVFDILFRDNFIHHQRIVFQSVDLNFHP
jgi:hypothetical protein